MERNQVSYKSVQKWGIILIVVVLALTWLAEFFFEKEYTEPIYIF
jgi:anaerobic C4-dicarboxylate transporter